ncbi:MAG: MarR family transcriptional regulator [Anaerolineaceae bacterium]
MSETLLALLHEYAEKAMKRSVFSFMNYIQQNNLSASQINAMFFLIDYPNSSMNSLSAKLGISRAAVSQLVEHLVRRGLVNRQVDQQDRRTKRLSLTEQGMNTMKEGQLARHKWLSELVNSFSPEEEAQLVPAIKILNAGMNKLAPEPPLTPRK